MTRDMTVWVHVGMPKCGSTTVQRHFSANAVAFRGQGLCYPETGRSKGGYRSHEPMARMEQALLPDLVRALREEAQGCSQILLSCEDFANALPIGNGPGLVDALNRQFGPDRVRIVAYFRNAHDFVESCYAQFILGGLFRINTGKFFQGAATDLSAFLEAFEGQKGFPLYSLLGHADLIARHFPQNRITLKSIERSDIGVDGLIGDLCAMLGVEPLAEAQAQNLRASSLFLAAAHYARRQVSDQAFRRAKPHLKRLLARPHWEARAEGFDQAGLHVDAPTHARIAARVAAEREALAGRFATAIDGICADRWVPRRAQDRLTAKEEAAIRRLLERLEAEALP